MASLGLRLFYEVRETPNSAGHLKASPEKTGPSKITPTYTQTSALAPGAYRVRRVIDGDTLALVGVEHPVRLQGVDAPETVDPRVPVEELGPQAAQFVRNFLRRAQYRLRFEIDGETIDRYGRPLVFAWHKGDQLNEQLVRAGLAEAMLDFPYSEQNKRRLRDAQSDAQRNRRGIWSMRQP